MREMCFAENLYNKDRGQRRKSEAKLNKNKICKHFQLGKVIGYLRSPLIRVLRNLWLSRRLFPVLGQAVRRLPAINPEVDLCGHLPIPDSPVQTHS